MPLIIAQRRPRRGECKKLFIVDASGVDTGGDALRVSWGINRRVLVETTSSPGFVRCCEHA
jgi:hypothetical protein